MTSRRAFKHEQNLGKFMNFHCVNWLLLIFFVFFVLLVFLLLLILFPRSRSLGLHRVKVFQNVHCLWEMGQAVYKTHKRNDSNSCHGIPILLHVCNMYHKCMVTEGKYSIHGACGIWLDHIYFRPQWKAKESAVVSGRPFCIPIAMILKSVDRPIWKLKSLPSHSWKMIWLTSSTSEFATKAWLEKGFIYLLVSK